MNMQSAKGWIAALAGLALVLYLWKGGDELAGAPKSVNGFVSVAMPDGASRNQVIIFAPNTPGDGAGRADALAEELRRAGIPYVRASTFGINIPDATPEQEAGMRRAMAVFEAGIPSVFVNGMAKANPTAGEVIAELERTR